MLLGSLMRQMHGAGIPKLRANKTFHGSSVDWLNKVVSGFTSPRLCIGFHSFPANSCRLEDRIQPCLEETLKLVKDLRLENIWDQRMQERESKGTESLMLRTMWRTTLTKRSTASS